VGYALPPEQRQRLLEMGLTVGAQFEVVRYAPMGDPIDIKVRGYHLSLRKNEAAGVLVTRL
jgi:Fe2+ transport system protein FeoA